MSRTMRQKHVLKEMFDDDLEPPKENQQIVRVINNRGNYLHEVEPSDDGENFLVSMPCKFRKNVWVKRNDLLIVDPIEEGDKVKAEISRILTPRHIKEFTKLGILPKKFTKKRDLENNDSDENEGSNSEFPMHNPNRKLKENMDDEESDEETSSEEDEQNDK